MTCLRLVPFILVVPVSDIGFWSQAVHVQYLFQYNFLSHAIHLGFEKVMMFLGKSTARSPPKKNDEETSRLEVMNGICDSFVARARRRHPSALAVDVGFFFVEAMKRIALSQKTWVF